MKTKTSLKIVSPLALLLAIGSADTNLASGQTDVVAGTPVIQPIHAPETDLGKVLAWDADTKTFEAKAGELNARFEFYVTNISSEVVVITNAQRSCGCTEATMPAQPWNLAPGESGAIKASIDLRGKGGSFTKLVTVQSPLGSKVLTLSVNIAPAPAAGADLQMDRGRNQQLAAQDRQAVFKGDCAKCHATPTLGKTGSELYQAGCAICHDAEHRAPIVPDLHNLKHPTDAAEWRQWITASKPGSLMPAFGKAFDGPLSNEQIESLVEYLSRTIVAGS